MWPEEGGDEKQGERGKRQGIVSKRGARVHCSVVQ